MTRLECEKEIDRAEIVLRRCWLILSTLKETGRIDDTEGLVNFQVSLSDCLFRLDSKVVALAQEINRRTRLKTDRVPLETFRAALSAVSDLAKAIGDAFVWMFYFRDKELLERHREQPSNGPSPATKGILALLLFKGDISIAIKIY